MRHATQNLGLICHTGAFHYFFVAKIVSEVTRVMHFHHGRLVREAVREADCFKGKRRV